MAVPCRSPGSAVSIRFIAWTVCKYLFAFSLLGWVVAVNWNPHGGFGLRRIFEAHALGRAPIRYGVFSLAVVLALAAAGLTFCRWYVLVRAQELPFRFPELLRLGAIALFFNAFLPGSVGGDVVKATLLARHPGRREAAVATVLFDRVVGLWSLAGFAALAGAALWAAGLLGGDAERPSKTLVVVSGITAGLGLLFWARLGRSPRWTDWFANHLARLPRIGKSAAALWRAGCLYRQRPASVLVAVLLSWAGQVLFVMTFYLCAVTLVPSANDVEVVPGLAEHFLIVPAGLVIRAVPLFPGAAGIAELGFAGLYQWFGRPAAGGVQAALVHRMVGWLLGFFGYLVYLYCKPVAELPPQNALQPLQLLEQS